VSYVSGTADNVLSGVPHHFAPAVEARFLEREASMAKRRARTGQQRRGVAAVELAFIAPVLLTLLMGLWEVGRLVEVQQILTNAVREGGRQASAGKMTASQIQAAVAFYCNQSGLSSVTASQVTVTDLTNPSLDPTAANQLDKMQVSIAIPFNSVRWVIMNQITNVTTLSASSVWYSMADVPLTINSNIPTY
jgi:Flp pilus assembly protein TadG